MSSTGQYALQYVIDKNENAVYNITQQRYFNIYILLQLHGIDGGKFTRETGNPYWQDRRTF